MNCPQCNSDDVMYMQYPPDLDGELPEPHYRCGGCGYDWQWLDEDDEERA